MRSVHTDNTTIDDPGTVFGEVVSRSHQIATRCDVLFDRQPVAEHLAVTAGSVTFDRTAARLASCDVTIADPTRIATTPTNVLTPYGYELRLWRGITTGDAVLLVALGTFPIQTSSVNAITLATSIRGEDRSRLVSDARFEDTYQIAAGTNYATAIQQLISAGVTNLDYLFPTTTYTTPTLTFDAQQDRWERAQQMAKSIGHELFFDGLGRCVLRPEPTFYDTPTAAITEGINLVDLTVGLDRQPAYNKVIATANNASNNNQYRGEAVDDDPASPTFYDGPFGRKPRFHTSEFYASNTQCATGAAAILAAQQGVAKTVQITATPDPRIEPSDIITIKREALGINETHIIDTQTISLGVDGAMTMNVRAQPATP